MSGCEPPAISSRSSPGSAAWRTVSTQERRLANPRGVTVASARGAAGRHAAGAAPTRTRRRTAGGVGGHLFVCSHAPACRRIFLPAAARRTEVSRPPPRREGGRHPPTAARSTRRAVVAGTRLPQANERHGLRPPGGPAGGSPRRHYRPFSPRRAVRGWATARSVSLASCGRRRVEATVRPRPALTATTSRS